MQRTAFSIATLSVCLLFLAGFFQKSLAADSPHVIASTKPLHSLVAAVMGATGTPEILVGGKQSPHDYQLKPSQVEALHHADIVFYIGPGLETFLLRTLNTLPKTTAVIAMIDQPDMRIYPPRTGGAWEPDADAPPDAHAQDPHIWLDTHNAKAMIAAIVQTLSLRYPQNTMTYKSNAENLYARLDALDADLHRDLAPVAGRPYIVFHDAYHYFERNYGLTAVGSITLEPDQAPSARRIVEIRKKIINDHVPCVFAEPQFNSRVVKTVVEGTQAKTGIVDEQGADLPEGPHLYEGLLRQAAANFVSCLKK